MKFKGFSKQSLVFLVIRETTKCATASSSSNEYQLMEAGEGMRQAPTALKVSRLVTQVQSNMVKNATSTKSVLGEIDPVTRRMSITAKRRTLGSRRRSLEETEEVLDLIK